MFRLKTPSGGSSYQEAGISFRMHERPPQNLPERWQEGPGCGALWGVGESWAQFPPPFPALTFRLSSQSQPEDGVGVLQALSFLLTGGS